MRFPRVRFGTKTLLALVVVVSVMLTAYSLLISSAHRQARAAAELRTLGAEVYYDHHLYYDEGLALNADQPAEDWQLARAVLGDDVFSEVISVRFIPYRPINNLHLSTPVANELSRNTDEHVALLEPFVNLRELNLEHTDVSDAAVPTLSKLTSLELLFIRRTQISYEGHRELLKALPKCKIFWYQDMPESRTVPREYYQGPLKPQTNADR